MSQTADFRAARAARQGWAAGRRRAGSRRRAQPARLWRTLFASVAAGALLALSGGLGSEAAAQESRGAFVDMPRGFVGPFLAARQAESDDDFSASAYYYRRALRADPENAAVRGLALRYSLIVGDVASALPIAERMADDRSRASNAPLVVGVAAISEGDWDKAIATLTDGGQPPILGDLLLGWAAYGAGDVDAAYGYFLANFDSRGKDVFGNEHAGHLAAALGDHADAAAYFEASKAALGLWTRETAIAAAAAYQAGDDDASAERVLGEALAGSAEDEALSAAQARLRAGEAVAPTVDSPAKGAALALVGVGRFIGDQQPEAVELGATFAQLARMMAPDLDQADILAGQRLYELDQYALAADAFADTPSGSLFAFDARFGGALATGGLGDLAKAIDQLTALIDDGAKGPRAPFALGAYASAQEQYGVCAEAYEDGVDRLRALVGELDSSHWRYLYYAGICRERSGDWDAAEAHFVDALALSPDQPDVLNYFGYSLVEQRRRFDEARDMIDRAVAQQPRSGHIVDSLGWVMWRTGDFEGAVRELARALELEPNVYEINDHYGDALWMVGRHREARYHWERALLFAPEDETITARIHRKLEIGLDDVLEEEGDAPPTPIEESSAAGDDHDAGVKGRSEFRLNDG